MIRPREANTFVLSQRSVNENPGSGCNEFNFDSQSTFTLLVHQHCAQHPSSWTKDVSAFECFVKQLIIYLTFKRMSLGDSLYEG